MPFKKGDTKQGGRKKGVKNMNTSDLRDKIKLLLDNNFDQVQTDIDGLKPLERIKVYIDLLQYSLPKLASTSIDLDLNATIEIPKVKFVRTKNG